MKKLFLSLIVAFAAQGAFANVLLEVQTSPLTVVEGAKSKYVRIFNSGEVHVTYCDVVHGTCDPSLYVARLSVYALNHIYNQIHYARYGMIVENQPLCTAVPHESKRYTADNGTVLLEAGTYPCGKFQQNQSDAAYYLLGILKQYEN